MVWFEVGLLAVGSYFLYTGVTMIQKMREHLKTGKTKTEGKPLVPGFLKPEIEKDKHATTFWMIWGWNGVRAVLCLLIGILLVIVSLAGLLGLIPPASG